MRLLMSAIGATVLSLFLGVVVYLNFVNTKTADNIDQNETNESSVVSAVPQALHEEQSSPMLATPVVVAIPTYKEMKEHRKEESLPTPPFLHTPSFSCESFLVETPFWTNEDSSVARQVKGLRAVGDSRADLLSQLACIPQALWIDATPFRTELLTKALKSAQEKDKTLILTLYNHPTHASSDWGSGIVPGEAYAVWVRDVARLIGDTNVYVIIEPDALSLIPNLSYPDRTRRVADLRAAVSAFKELSSGAQVYIDAGHSDWRPYEHVADLLLEVGVEQARGFSLNIANYRTTEEAVEYATRIVARIPTARAIIDSSRNGVGPALNNEWCNAPGRRVGQLPHVIRNHAVLDAILWIKPPGESDGTCNGGPPAGKFWLEYALELVSLPPKLPTNVFRSFSFSNDLDLSVLSHKFQR
jgi:endoglucanase